MAQIPEEVTKAILGNAGTMISFAIGADDAEIINKEFAEVFSQNDLVNLSNYQIALKLMIDGYSSRPFLAHTLPLPASKNENRQKVIESSRARWAEKSVQSGTLQPKIIQRQHGPHRKPYFLYHPPFKPINRGN
jgi:hypothetical protein